MTTTTTTTTTPRILLVTKTSSLTQDERVLLNKHARHDRELIAALKDRPHFKTVRMQGTHYMIVEGERDEILFKTHLPWIFPGEKNRVALVIDQKLMPHLDQDRLLERFRYDRHNVDLISYLVINPCPGVEVHTLKGYYGAYHIHSTGPDTHEILVTHTSPRWVSCGDGTTRVVVKPMANCSPEEVALFDELYLHPDRYNIGFRHEDRWLDRIDSSQGGKLSRCCQTVEAGQKYYINVSFPAFSTNTYEVLKTFVDLSVDEVVLANDPTNPKWGKVIELNSSYVWETSRRLARRHLEERRDLLVDLRLFNAIRRDEVASAAAATERDRLVNTLIDLLSQSLRLVEGKLDAAKLERIYDLMKRIYIRLKYH